MKRPPSSVKRPSIWLEGFNHGVTLRRDLTAGLILGYSCRITCNLCVLLVKTWPQFTTSLLSSLNLHIMAWEHLDTAPRPVKVESSLPEMREEVLRLQKQVDETIDRLHQLNFELAKAKKTVERLERESQKTGEAQKAKDAGLNDLDTETDDDFMVVAQGHPLEEESQVTIESLKKFEQRMHNAWAKALKNLGNNGNDRNSGARYTDRLRRLHTWSSSQQPNHQAKNAQGEAQPEFVLDLINQLQRNPPNIHPSKELQKNLHGLALQYRQHVLGVRKI